MACALVAGCARPGTLPGPAMTHIVTVSAPAGPVPSSGSPRATPATCTGGVLLSLDQADGAAGLRAMPLYLTNCGTATMTVTGYPAITLRDKDGAVITVVTVQHGVTKNLLDPRYDQPPKAVTLAPGQRAVSVLVWRNTYAPTAEAPDNINAVYLDTAVTPGGPVQRLSRPPAGAVLDLGNTNLLEISPWLPGSDPTA